MAFIHPVTLTFDPLALELLCNVARGAINLPANFGACATFRCLVMGKHASH